MAVDNKAKILREGERYVQQGKIALAINEYLKIIKEEPEDILTLNTLGDLYLRQRRIGDANQLFLRVADNYERNNFLLKAIAVYKKILNTDSANLHVLQLLASLYARQGMNVEACNQYMLIGDMMGREGRSAESLEAYEKVVEIDPSNTSMLLQLAETYLEQNNKEKAYLLFAGAARAQTKAGNVSDAMRSFRRALAVNWASSDALKGFLETALQSGNLNLALQQIQECIKGLPEDPALQMLLGRVYQASGDLENAEPCLVAALKADDSQYIHLLELSRQFLQEGNQDRALRCLEPIVPVLIAHREIDTLVHAYNLILAENPFHLQTLLKLSDILSSYSEDARYIGALERIAQIYQSAGKPGEALKYAEKILEAKPDSQDHFDLHCQLFTQAYPGKPYQLPRATIDTRHEAGARFEDPAASAVSRRDAEESSSIVEIDLLLNYGLKEKALQLLRTLEKARPEDKEVRQRLADMYQESGQRLPAAQQHVLLSVLHRKSGDQDAARQSWSEAEALAPNWAKAGLDVSAFAREHGVTCFEAYKAAAGDKAAAASLEVDLSGDLSEIFFQDVSPEPAPPAGRHEIRAAAGPDAGIEEFAVEMRRPAAQESAEEQLQEVDFYIRLGFQDEARAKLVEIAAAFPGHPELVPRFAQLGFAPVESAEAIPLAAPGAQESEPSARPGDHKVHADSSAPDLIPAKALPGHDLESALTQFGQNNWFDIKEDEAIEILSIDESKEDEAIEIPPIDEGTPESKAGTAPQAPAVIPAPAAPQSPAVTPVPEVESPGNLMFSDLIAEVNSLTNQEIIRDDYETHFNLGTAYHEMGLDEDAIREFQTAVKILDPEKSPKEAIRCCGMLSTCFLAKGMPRSAIRWCQTGLSIKEISSHETIALRYDMGVAHAAAGESERALECFGMIFGIDPAYRDVAQRIDDLKIGLERNAP